MAQDSRGPRDVVALALRRARTRAGLSLGELARSANIAKSTLSQLESGGGNPSLETLWALSMALGVAPSELLDPPRPRSQVIRAGEGSALQAAEADYRAILLAACPPNARRDIYLITAEPGSARESEPHMPGVVEHVVLSGGRARVGTADDPAVLGPGDYIVYPADVAHVFEATAKGTKAVLLSEYR